VFTNKESLQKAKRSTKFVDKEGIGTSRRKTETRGLKISFNALTGMEELTTKDFK
jgi:hypothetical protein